MLRNKYIELHNRYSAGSLTEAEESDLLGEMDDIWYELTDTDRAFLNAAFSPKSQSNIVREYWKAIVLPAYSQAYGILSVTKWTVPSKAYIAENDSNTWANQSEKKNAHMVLIHA